jgi:dienelactone hydrolase
MADSRAIRHEFGLDIDGGASVPSIFQIPRSSQRVPGVVLLHGFSSRKERMADSIGRSLGDRGVASLAIDLPLHGTRDGGLEGLSLRNPLDLVQKWRLAVREASTAIRYLADQPAIDPRRLAIAGYSLGAYLAVIVASDTPLVRAVALAAGGDLPETTPFAGLVRTFADPRKAVRALAGRPLLMVNGRSDRTIQPSQARALFDAAGEPKEIQWYDGGHWPPPAAIELVADWLAGRLRDADRQPSRTAKTSSHGAQ